jgi:hypothetical protein
MAEPDHQDMRDFSADHRWLSINTATVRDSGLPSRLR